MPKPPHSGAQTAAAPSSAPVFHRRGSIVAKTPAQIPQNTAWEATSVVWSGASGKGALNHPGHAALCLRRTMDSNPDFAEVNMCRYVSFIPGASRNTNGVRPGRFTPGYNHDLKYELGRAEERLQNRQFTPSSGQVVIDHNFYGHEYGGEEVFTEEWAKIADKFVSMQGMDLSSWGINLNRIVDWCMNFWVGEDCYYEFISNSHNCASVVWRALTCGGGKAFAEIHGNCPNHKVYITPDEFSDFCVNIREGIQKVNQAASYICNTYNDKSIARDLMSGAPIGWSSLDLYKPEDWKKESSVSWKTRGLILRRIDDALVKYHKLTWDGNYNDKLLEVLKIIIALQEHFLVSKSGKRDAALCALAKQVFVVKSSLDTECIKMWELLDYYGVAANDLAVHRTGARPISQVMVDRFAHK